MAVPVGAYPVGAAIVDISGTLLAASPELRDAGAISVRNGDLTKVNAAGNDWESIALPTGSPVNDQMAYINGAWAAVSSAEAGFFMLTRGDTLVEMAVGLIAALDLGGRANAVLFDPNDTWAFRGSLSYTTFSAAHVQRIEDTALPYFWIIAPNRWDWARFFHVQSLNKPVVVDLVPVTTRGSIRVDGVLYDTAVVQVQPPNNTSWTARFIAPAATHNVTIV